MFIVYSVYHNQDGIMCTSFHQEKEPNLQATKRRDEINYSNKMKKQEEIECYDIFGFRMSIQYKINSKLERKKTQKFVNVLMMCF
jgi:hypothetical protein